MAAAPMVVMLLLACGAQRLEDDGTGVLVGSAKASGGVADFKVELGAADKLSVTFTPDAEQVFTRAIEDERDLVFDANDVEGIANHSVYGGMYFAPEVTMNWPTYGADAPLDGGDWTLSAGVVDSDGFYQKHHRVDARAVLVPDDDLSSGSLPVEIVFVGDLSDDAEFVATIDDAIAVWRDDYAAIGVTLDVQTHALEGPGTVAAPGYDTTGLYLAASQLGRPRAVHVVLVELIDDNAGLYGFAGSIPGSLTPGDASVVAVSAFANAGSDLVYSASDTRVLGETMGHEVGHYLGLFHPVETSFSQWDAIDDTPECTSQGDCELALGDNLMFPYPLCDLSGDCDPQPIVSDGQGEVINLCAAVE